MENEMVNEPGVNSNGWRSNTNHTLRWVLIAAFFGLLLPAAACAFLVLLSIFSFGFSGSDFTAGSPFAESVAIVRVDGVISASDGEDGATGAPSGRVRADLKAATDDSTVKAIVLRVDSPGGSVTGSTQIYEDLLNIDKPIVASMASVAASGGYYVSIPADHIIARPDTLTGSIGVISTFINGEEFFDELGVEANVMASGPNKDFGSLWHDLTPEQEHIWQTVIDEHYNDFVAAVVEGRSMPEDQVRQLADGRVYSGRQALENGLVDELGNLQDAIDTAAELGGIEGEPRVTEYLHAPTLQNLLTGLSAKLSLSQSAEILQMIQDLTTPSLEYRYIGPT